MRGQHLEMEGLVFVPGSWVTGRNALGGVGGTIPPSLNISCGLPLTGLPGCLRFTLCLAWGTDI